MSTFAIQGARDTDGIDVCSLPLGKAFPKGLFACHSAEKGKCPVLLTPWDAAARSASPELKVDTGWKLPR